MCSPFNDIPRDHLSAFLPAVFPDKRRSNLKGLSLEIGPGHAKSVEWFIEGQAFLRSYDLAPPTSSTDRWHTGKTEKERQLADRTWGGGEGGERGVESTRARKPMALYISFNTLWVYAFKSFSNPVAQIFYVHHRSTTYNREKLFYRPLSSSPRFKFFANYIKEN